MMPGEAKLTEICVPGRRRIADGAVYIEPD